MSGMCYTPMFNVNIAHLLHRTEFTYKDPILKGNGLVSEWKMFLVDKKLIIQARSMDTMLETHKDMDEVSDMQEFMQNTGDKIRRDVIKLADYSWTIAQMAGIRAN